MQDLRQEIEELNSLIESRFIIGVPELGNIMGNCGYLPAFEKLCKSIGKMIDMINSTDNIDIIGRISERI